MTLEQAISKLNADLPGWWWSVGLCSVSAHASIAPDRNWPDADLLADKLFDDGFHADFVPPASVVDALLHCIEQGLDARRRAKGKVSDRG